jgi:hypothetical protein
VNDFWSNISSSGIPRRENNICGNWRSSLGRCPSWLSCTAYFDSDGSQAVKDTSARQDKLIELFNRIEHFFRRLEIYTGITPTAAMTDIVVEIMVEVLTILGIATKEVKRGRFSELTSCQFTAHD